MKEVFVNIENGRGLHSRLELAGVPRQNDYVRWFCRDGNRSCLARVLAVLYPDIEGVPTVYVKIIKDCSLDYEDIDVIFNDLGIEQ